MRSSRLATFLTKSSSYIRLVSIAAVVGLGVALVSGCGSINLGTNAAGKRDTEGEIAAITSQPASMTVPAGQAASFSVSASGTGTLT